jgi:hypothetical protein
VSVITATVRVMSMVTHINPESQEGERPVYMQVSWGALVLHLSSHDGDDTPGAGRMVARRRLLSSLRVIMCCPSPGAR